MQNDLKLEKTESKSSKVLVMPNSKLKMALARKLEVTVAEFMSMRNEQLVNDSTIQLRGKIVSNVIDNLFMFADKDSIYEVKIQTMVFGCQFLKRNKYIRILKPGREDGKILILATTILIPTKSFAVAELPPSHPTTSSNTQDGSQVLDDIPTTDVAIAQNMPSGTIVKG